MLKWLKVCGFACAALGLPLACKQTSDSPTPSVAGNTGVATAGTGGSAPTAGSTAQPDGQGGAVDDDTTRKGERGSSCDSTNDCADGLSCVIAHDCPTGTACTNKSCQPSNFGITGTGKRCFVHECDSKADCCGDMPTTAPAKCNNRLSICSTPTLTGCTTKLCTANKDCAPGVCSVAYCSLIPTGGTATSCSTTTDCAVNTCDAVTHKCSITGTDCTTYACATNTCPSHYCDCKNPVYAPTSTICTDPDCDGICGFTCTDERCVTDKRCNLDTECGLATPFCDKGTCVQCKQKADCENEEDCIDGHCGPQCETDTQCKLFEACQSGKCKYVGCRSDRECVLKAGNTSTQDPRLAKCQIDQGLGTCVFPCEVDAQCATSEVCLDGVCEYIGCETDSECKTITGLQNLPAPTPERPWTTKVECRAESNPAP